MPANPARIWLGLDMTVSSSITTFSYIPGGAMLAQAMTGLVFINSSDLVVKDAAGALQILGTDYEITGNGRAGTASIRTLRAFGAGVELTITRKTEIKQEANIQAGVPLAAEALETELDRQTLVHQDNKRDLEDLGERAVQVDIGEIAPYIHVQSLIDGDLIQYNSGRLTRLPREQFAGKFYGGDATGKPIPLNGTGNDAALRTDLASVLGAAMFGFSHAQAYSAGTPGAHLKSFVVANDAPWLAKGDGSAGDGARIQACVDYVKGTTGIGGEVALNTGTYSVEGAASPDAYKNGIVMAYTGPNGHENRVTLRGAGKSTRLLAASNDMIVVRMSDSHCAVENLTISGQGKTNVWGIGLVPQNLNQTTQVVFQLYNLIDRVYFQYLDEGVVFRTGPDVAGSDSGCWYNTVQNSFAFQTKRILWWAPCPVGSSGSNRNRVINFRGGQGCNTGAHIQDGTENKLFSCDFEGIDTGTSPNAIPSAFIIENTGQSGLDNNNNILDLCTAEACTRRLNNANPTTEIYGGLPGTGSLLLTARPRVFIGGDPSLEPQIFGKFIYQAGPFLAGFLQGYHYSVAEYGLAVEPAGIHGFRNDETTGLGRAATGTGRLMAAGIERARWTTTLFGIGVTTPDSTLQVANAAGAGFRVGISSTAENYLDGSITHFRTNTGVEIFTAVPGAIRSGADNARTLGEAAFRFSTVFAGTGTINTSDERDKRDIGAIPDDWLDAWGEVEWVRYKFIGGNRWHTGLVAQQVHASFAKYGIDAFEIGLCGFDQWDDIVEPIYETVMKTRTVELDGEEIEEEYHEVIDTGETRIVRAAGDRWNIRPSECEAMEAAWQRRKMNRLEARLAALEGAGA